MMTEDELDKAESYWTSQEKDAKKMPAEVLREKAEAFLTSHNTCALACGAGDSCAARRSNMSGATGPSGSSPKADSSSMPSARICG